MYLNFHIIVYLEPVTAVVESDKQGAKDKFATGLSAANHQGYSSPSVTRGERSKTGKTAACGQF